MRRTRSRLLAIATLAAAALTWTTEAVAAPVHVYCRGRALHPHSEADAVAHCGARPASAGPWRCIGDQRARKVTNLPHPPRCDGYEPTISWRWYGPQEQYQDSWTE
jgi:hypothetical protein